ncbi:MAG: PorT family protein [Cytophagaceae bacterium]|nr:PorT family protein [Cytophagaceae bacterium]
MNNSNFKFFLLTILLGFFTSGISVRAQDSVNVCTQTLNDAQDAYDAGKLSGIPAMLEGCLKDGFTRAEKLSALRVLILTYLFQDEDELAEQTLLALLKEDPEYKVNEALDPAEFIYLYNTYRTLPVVSIGLIGGVNQSRMHLSQEFSTDNINNSEVKYSPGMGYQFGVIADILLYKNFQINTAILFSGKKYQMDSEKLFSYTNLNLIENQTWMHLPVTLKYNFGKKKLVPFIQAGMSLDLFLASSGNIKRTSIENDNDASGPSVQMSSLRNKLNYSAVFGAGARYKIGYGYAILDVRYNLGLRNIVNVKNRYSNNELVYYYGYIDSDSKLHNIMISVGYLKSLYKPKKIKVKNA